MDTITDDALELLRYPIGRFQRPTSFTQGQQKEWISVLEALPSWLDACIENLDAAQLETPYRPGGWTIIQTIHHVADSHINAYVRLKLALTENAPTIKPYQEALWAETPEVSIVPVNISTTLLHALHIRLVAILKNLKAEDWERTYFHPDQERQVPLYEMTAMYAWHSRHHMEHIRRLRDRMGW